MADLKNFVSDVGIEFLNEFLAPLRDDEGIALPSRYEVMFFRPTGVRGTGDGNNSNPFSFPDLFDLPGNAKPRDVSLQCNKVEFPGRNLDTTEDTNIYGPLRNVVNGFSFGDITASFYMSDNYKEKQFFERWQTLAYDSNQWAMKYYDDYVGGMDIYSLDRDNARRYGVRLYECFPKTINAQPLDAQPATTPQTVDVTFAYRYWQNLTDESQFPKPILETFQRVLANNVERVLLNNIPKVIKRL